MPFFGYFYLQNLKCNSVKKKKKKREWQIINTKYHHIVLGIYQICIWSSLLFDNIVNKLCIVI